MIALTRTVSSSSLENSCQRFDLHGRVGRVSSTAVDRGYRGRYTSMLTLICMRNAGVANRGTRLQLKFVQNIQDF